MLSDQELSEKADLSGDTFLNELWYAIRKNKMAMAGGIVIILLILIALFASYISPYDPYHVDLDMQLQKPSAEHWLGTDEFGRDLLTRIMFGTRISLAIGLIPTILSLFIGTILGMVSGYYGKRTDFIIMRIADVVLAFPELLLAMVIMYTLGANILNIFIALSLVRWARVARVVRAQTMSIKEKEYVEASRAIGVKNWIIMFRHILPNCLSSLIVLFTLDIPNAILSEASLSFLGIGAQPPAASWGLMISRGKEYLFSAPWVAISPGIAILLIVLAFNYLGDGLRDALDPYMKQ
ncbi:MAG: peptide ABC transporter permease [Clostridia bacterium BRH_c25]|nr:MAG: peptide ABC transporter permease [Clostridia bacterium BRH_c25]